MPRRLIQFLAVFFLSQATGLCGQTATGTAGQRIRFRVTLSRELPSQRTGGRLLVFMASQPQKPQRLGAAFIPGETWVAARELPILAPGQSVELDPDELAYPAPFSQAMPGTHQFMALLDPDHSYARAGQDGGDLYGPVVTVADLIPTETGTIDLLLDQVMKPSAPLVDTETVKLVEFQSPLLTAFWGRPITIDAGVVLPPVASRQPGRKFPTVYHVHGFGGSHADAWYAGPRLTAGMATGKWSEMVHVFLNASCPTGHHVFADSVNNGPWGQALTREFIPFLEKRFPLVRKPYARFLTGHSSGGWSTLWLQITYPEFFGGTWSTAPDPVDLRSFTGIDVTPGSTENAYRTRAGKARNLVRREGKELASFEAFAKQEVVLGDFGGQIASFEWVWSPRGQDGRPLPLFNRVTGEQNLEVQRAWQKYDIRRVLEDNWSRLGPKLRGKLHVICGSEDTFHLEEAVRLLQEFFHRIGSDAVCEIVPGRDHGTLFQPYTTYPKGLLERIDGEMWAAFKRGGRPQKAAASGQAAVPSLVRGKSGYAHGDPAGVGGYRN